MNATNRILFLDDDHVLRLARYALAGPGEVTDAWVRAFFAPETVEPAAVLALGDGLHGADGVALTPFAPRTDPDAGTDATIVVFRRGAVSAAMIGASPNLRLVARLGERPDGIDLAAAAAHHVLVSCVPRRTLRWTAEHAILLMLVLSKRLPAADAFVRQGGWDPARVHPVDAVAYNWPGMAPVDGLYGKTLGIVGLGEVGALAAGLAGAFGMRVLYSNRRRLPADQEAQLGVAFAPFADLLREADFVSLHASNLPENRGLFDGAAFASMKRTAFFVNTSRGKLVDEDALFAALTNGWIAGAGLDVHAEEPRRPGDRFAALPNVIMTPHHAGGSRRGVLQEIESVFDDCRHVLAGRAPRYRVTAPVLPAGA